MTKPSAMSGAAGRYPQTPPGPYPQTPYGQPPQPPMTRSTGPIVNGHMWNGSQWVPAPPSSQNAPPPPQQPGGHYGPNPSAGMPLTTPPRPKKPIYKRWWVWVVGAVVLLIVIGIAGGSGDNQVATPAASAPATKSSAKESAKAPATTEPPQPAGNEEIAQQYGTFDTLSKAGTGDATIKLPSGAKAGMVTATHKGSANFVISALDENNESTGDLLVNEIGGYKGVTAFGLNSVTDAVKLKVEADGAWTIKISSLDKAPSLDLPVKQEGDKVYIYSGKAADWAITNNGKSNFVVIQQTAVMPNLMVNEIGKYKGTVPANAGPNVVTIQSDGSWTISES